MTDHQEKSKKEEDKDMKDRVQKITTRNFYICKCPEIIYQEFVKFAETYTGNNYTLALKLLLDYRKINEMVNSRFMSIEREIENVWVQLDGITVPDVEEEKGQEGGKPLTFADRRKMNIKEKNEESEK